MSNVERNKVVEFHYELSTDDGDLVDTTRDSSPVAILIGHGNIIPGLEAALSGHAVGDRFKTTVEPEQGYGMRREGWIERVSKKHFVDAKRLKPGMEAAYRTDRGVRSVTVVKVGSKVLDVDMNHPLAGRQLNFDVEILSVRDAEPQELAHGHAHGPGGHGH
jgi:FKBP-type peptidyl-prolyl cis-trans isomerase SlyD